LFLLFHKAVHFRDTFLSTATDYRNSFNFGGAVITGLPPLLRPFSSVFAD